MTHPPRTASPPSTRRRVWPHRLVALVLVLSGGAVSGWPVAETAAGNAEGAREVTAYVDAVAALTADDPAPLNQDLARARAYNATLSPAALWDPWGAATPGSSETHDDYLAQLGRFEAMGRVRIPRIAVDLPILHDATKLPLSRGVGHMFGTSLPVGGPGTHAVLAAHTGLKGRTMFDRLPDVRLGDLFFVDVAGTTLTYRVDRIIVVEPWQLGAVERTAEADRVTLVTCVTPPGSSQQRLLVRGDRVPDPPAPAVVAAAAATVPLTVPATGPATDQRGSEAPTTDAPAADGSVQGWVVPRLAVAGGAAVLAVTMCGSWVVGDRRETRRQRGTSTLAAGMRGPAGARP